jgi:hypothetical protein
MNHLSGSAIAAAFAIPEVLENVLRHLPPRDIFRAKRTSKFFEAVVQGSQLIQEDLFLRPRIAGHRAINNLIFILEDDPVRVEQDVVRYRSDRTSVHGPFQLAVRLADVLLQLNNQAKVLDMLVVQPVVLKVTARAVSFNGCDPGRCRITNPAGVTLRDVVDQYSWWSDRNDLIKNVWLYLGPDPPRKAGKRPGNAPRVIL